MFHSKFLPHPPTLKEGKERGKGYTEMPVRLKYLLNGLTLTGASKQNKKLNKWLDFMRFYGEGFCVVSP